MSLETSDSTMNLNQGLDASQSPRPNMYNKVLAENSEWARVILAFLGTAGLFYVNIMPALVDGLVTGLGFSNQQAGQVSSANVYGAAVGAMVIVLLVKKINWRMLAYSLLVALIAIDGFTMLLSSPTELTVVRFLHGVVGGALVGTAFSVIARMHSPDKTFGYLLTVQFGLGGLGLILIPPLVPVYGTSILFITLILFSLATLAMIPLLGAYPPKGTIDLNKAEGQQVSQVDPSVNLEEEDTTKFPKRFWFIALALMATFLFQAANMGLYAYIIGLGKQAGQDLGFISNTLGWSAWIAISGSALVILIANKYGRTKPLMFGVVFTLLGTWALYFSATKWVFWIANVRVGITWAFVISYLLGLCSAFDSHGQMAALGGFASKMGLATGPLVASLLVGEDQFYLLIDVALYALVLCLILVLLPSKVLDRQQLAPLKV